MGIDHETLAYRPAVTVYYYHYNGSSWDKYSISFDKTGGKLDCSSVKIRELLSPVSWEALTKEITNV